MASDKIDIKVERIPQLRSSFDILGPGKVVDGTSLSPGACTYVSQRETESNTVMQLLAEG